MIIESSTKTTQTQCLEWKKSETIALVPTMGCLHEGHLSLVRLARQNAAKVVVSIFVNPLQFGPNEDLEKYPRSFAADCAKLKALGVNLLFAPTVPELYPDGFQTRVLAGSLAKFLCGGSRPGHFDGVATICLKLFQIVQPNVAVFGEKDFQQLRVLQQLVLDFNLPLQIIPHKIVRETDGLALSSRNAYLSAGERERARLFPKALESASELVHSNRSLAAGEVLARTSSELSRNGFIVDYIEITESETLEPAQKDTLLHTMKHPRLFAAVLLGSTRLIDNIALGVPAYEKN